MLYAFSFGCETCGAIESIHGAVEDLVSSSKLWRHQIGVVEVGQRSVRMSGASIEHGLRQRLQFRPIWTSRRHRKSIIDDSDGIHVTAFQTPRHRPHPGHVHGGGEQGEVSKGSIFQDADKVARDHRRDKPTYGHIVSPFGTNLRHHQKQRAGENVDQPESRSVG